MTPPFVTHHETRGLRTSAQICLHGCEGSKEQKPAERGEGRSPGRPEGKERRLLKQCLGAGGHAGFSPLPVQSSHFTTQERHTFSFLYPLETRRLKRKRVHIAWKAVGLQS